MSGSTVSSSLRHAAPALALLSLIFAGACSLEQRGSKENADVRIETPFGGMKVKTNDNATGTDLGIPVYPGASLAKMDKDKAADVNMNFGGFHLRVKAVAYNTPDAPDQVKEFYRKGLSRYGDVIECRGKQVVGKPERTKDGLSCDDDHKVQLNNVGSNSDTVLKAGSKTNQHLVSIERESRGTKFGLIALELPGGDKENDGRVSN